MFYIKNEKIGFGSEDYDPLPELFILLLLEEWFILLLLILILLLLLLF